MNIRSLSSRYVAILIINALFWHPVVVLADGIVVAPGAGNTALDRAGNGVPVVDIATPNGSGLSHNRFSDYNVDEGGVILNNATSKLQSTQLGGLIVGNPNLRDQAASRIINEGGCRRRCSGCQSLRHHLQRLWFHQQSAGDALHGPTHHRGR